MSTEMAPNVKVVQCVPPQSIDGAAVNGAVVDTHEFGEVLFCLNTGTVLATGTLNVKVQEDDNLAFGSPTDVAGAAFTEVVPANDVAVFFGKVKAHGARQRYLRLVHTAATAASTSGSVAVLGKPITEPAQVLQFSV